MVTGVSAMEWASFARVFPVQGAMMRMSNSFFGPTGSTWARVCSGGVPQMVSAMTICSRAVPKRLSTL